MLGGVLLFLVGGARAHVSLLWPPGDPSQLGHSVDEPCNTVFTPPSFVSDIPEKDYLPQSFSYLFLLSEFPHNLCPPSARAPGLDFLDNFRTDGDCGTEPGKERSATSKLINLSDIDESSSS